MRNKTAIAAAGVALLAGLGLTGCGDDAAEGTTPESAAPATTEAPAPAKIEEPSAAPEKADEHSATFKVTSDGETASVTLTTFNGGKIAQSQDTEAALPWEKTVPLEEKGMFDVSSLSVIAQADGSASTISCEIIVDGESVAKQTSTGAYSLVTCNGS